VARLGGDEFVLLLSGMKDIDECQRTLERLLRSVAKPYTVETAQVELSASVGVSIYPLDDTDPDTLLRHADQAMYAAKESGRNRYHLFDPEHDRRARAQREAMSRIEAGLENGEFRLYYQPKVDMRRGRVVGAEALIRWQHPERGLLPPAEFLSYIDGTELSVGAGEWVIGEALKQMEAGRRAGLDLPVSVNISARHLQSPGFTDYLTQALNRHDRVPAGNLELEILETSALDDLMHVTGLIEECRKLGVTFALDDFGTGYSSLSYFKRLSAETLKIDQSFVRDMLRDSEDMAIVDGIIGLADAFQRKVIAEGVEEVEHGILLLHLGCDLAQGFAIARPMPAEAIPGWVAAWHPHADWSLAARTKCAKQDLPILVAELDHRHWIDALSAWIESRGPNAGPPPALNAHTCRFGRWYDSAGQSRYGEVADFRALADAHDRIHVIGRELVAMKMAGQFEQASQGLDELFAQRDTLLAQMRSLREGLAEVDGI
jgi:EAL domain-containing protein (putative c-di-GMP-specific phosphodiesterase class I)